MRIGWKTGNPNGDFSFMQEDEFFDYFSQQVNLAKLCKNNTGCFYSGAYKQLSGATHGYYDNKNSLVTSDGIAYNWVSSNYKGPICQTAYTEQQAMAESDVENCLGRFLVDVNGNKGPNRFGYDTFFFVVIDKKGVLPYGYAGYNNGPGACNIKSLGVNCAARVLYEGKIDY